jgi:hypothetical protein
MIKTRAELAFRVVAEARRRCWSCPSRAARRTSLVGSKADWDGPVCALDLGYVPHLHNIPTAQQRLSC